MADTCYTIIKNKLLSKLQGITKLQEVYDEPRLEFTGYPSAIIIPSDQDSDYETTTENLRIYVFLISLFYGIPDSGISSALDALYDLADDVMDTFDKDQTLTGISLPTGYTMIGVEPASAGWSEIPDKKLLEVDLKLKIRVSVDIV